MGVWRFAVRGEIDLATVPDLHTKIDVLIRGIDDDLVLDCEGLTFIDCTGINMFLYTQHALEGLGRGCRIENLSPRWRRLFDVLGLSEEFGLRELEPA